MPAVELSNVDKRFGETHALRRVTLSVAEGELIVLLGHNGAGKTVTVRLLSTMSWPSNGTVKVCGFDTRTHPTDVRRRIGVCLDTPLLWPRLTGGEHVALIADAYGVAAGDAWRDVNRVLGTLGLDLPRSTPVEDYSLGMKRKLGLALSLLHRPSVLIWDEPEIGLDAVSRVRLRALIGELRDARTTILLTTHALELAGQLADRVAVLSHGRLAAVDTVEGLRAHRHTDATLEDAVMALLSRDHAIAVPEP